LVDVVTPKTNCALRLTKGIHQSLLHTIMLIQPIKLRWQKNVMPFYLATHFTFDLWNFTIYIHYKFYLGEPCSLDVLEGPISFIFLFFYKFRLLGRFMWRRRRRHGFNNFCNSKVVTRFATWKGANEPKIIFHLKLEGGTSGAMMV
jgi:hypothetical protein